MNESKMDGCDKNSESEVFHEPKKELAGGVPRLSHETANV